MPGITTLAREIVTFNPHYRPTNYVFGPVPIEKIEPLWEALERFGLSDTSGSPSVGQVMGHPERPDTFVSLFSRKPKEGSPQEVMVKPSGASATIIMNTVGRLLKLEKRPDTEIVDTVSKVASALEPIAPPSIHSPDELDTVLNTVQAAGYDLGKAQGMPSTGMVITHPNKPETQLVIRSNKHDRPRQFTVGEYNRPPVPAE
jgi:hypothetical protein